MANFALTLLISLIAPLRQGRRGLGSASPQSFFGSFLILKKNITPHYFAKKRIIFIFFFVCGGYLSPSSIFPFFNTLF